MSRNADICVVIFKNFKRCSQSSSSSHATTFLPCLVLNAACCCSVVAKCLTLCYPMDHSLPGSSVHGILQERILEWVAFSFSKIQPTDWTGRLERAGFGCFPSSCQRLEDPDAGKDLKRP